MIALQPRPQGNAKILMVLDTLRKNLFLIANVTVFGWLCICSNIAFLDVTSLWLFIGP